MSKGKEEKMEQNAVEKYVVAIHEAGHAVMSVLLKRALYYVTIITNDDSEGHCLNDINYDIENGKTEAERMYRLKRECQILLAGVLAEKEFGLFIEEELSGGYAGDLENLAELIRSYSKGEDHMPEWFKAVYINAIEIIKDPKTKLQIKAVAGALIEQKYLSGVKVKRIMTNRTNNYNDGYKRQRSDMM